MYLCKVKTHTECYPYSEQMLHEIRRAFLCSNIDIGGCLSHYYFALRAESVCVLTNSGNGNRSFLVNLPKCQNTYSMKKQTVTLPIVEAKEPALTVWLKKEAKLHSLCLGRPISNAMVLRIIHAEIAGLFVVFSPSAGATASLICCAWFIVSLYLCKKGGKQ